jgi:hypothetical protein
MTHKDLCTKAQEILSEHLQASPQADRSIVNENTISKLIILFDGPEQREADRNAQDPAEYSRRLDAACKDAGGGLGWNRRFRTALNRHGLTLATAMHPHDSTTKYPEGHPHMAPAPYGQEDAWPKETMVVWARVDSGSPLDIPAGSGDFQTPWNEMYTFCKEQFGFGSSPFHLARTYLDEIRAAYVARMRQAVSVAARANEARVDNGSAPNIPTALAPFAVDTFHYDCIELLRGVLNSTNYPTSIENMLRWHPVYRALSEQHKIFLEALLLKGLRERGSILTPVDGKSIIDQATIIQQHDGSKAISREVVLNIAGHCYSAQQTLEAIMKLLNEEPVGEPNLVAELVDSVIKDQRTKDLESIIKNNAGTIPRRFRHLMPGSIVWSPLKKDISPPIKVKVEQINDVGIIFMHPTLGRTPLMWYNTVEEQRRTLSIVVAE